MIYKVIIIINMIWCMWYLRLSVDGQGVVQTRNFPAKELQKESEQKFDYLNIWV